MHKLRHTIITATSLAMILANGGIAQAHQFNFTQPVMHHSDVATTGTMTDADTSTSTSQSMNTISSFLAGLAVKSGLISPTPAYAQVSATGQAPTLQQAVAAMHALPTPVQYGPNTHTPDPTPAEMPFVQPGATDAAGNAVADPTPGLIFGTITAADETITGLFDDLANLPTTNDPAATDSGTSSGAGAAQQIIGDGTQAALAASMQAIHLQQVAATVAPIGTLHMIPDTQQQGVYTLTSSKLRYDQQQLRSSLQPVALMEFVAPQRKTAPLPDELVVDTGSEDD